MGKAKRITNEETLRAEANRLNYRLRSTFFYRKLKEYNTLSFPPLVADLVNVEHFYSWEERKQWGIGDDAYHYVASHPELHLFQVFCHPKVIREHPRLLAYYRNIAVLPQKAVSYLASIKASKFESDTGNLLSLDTDQALRVAKLFNEHITLIVDASIQSLTKEELHGILLTSTGAQIDGSWRNTIGEEAEKVVQRLLVNEVKERKLLGALFPRLGTAVERYDPSKLEEQLGNIHKYRGILLTNGTSVLFSSEPDISLLDVSGSTVCAIEVKGGNDPAGALERYGAAKKSFEHARRHTPNVPTILLASCITPEVRTRIRQDSWITSYFNLTELLSEGAPSYNEFMNKIFILLGVETSETV